MEQYRTVQGYEGLYEVSNYGNVKSLGNDKSRKEKLLKPNVNNRGYMVVGLCRVGKMKTHQVHRLVANAFLPNPDNLPQVNHKDECPTNNCVFVNADGTIDESKSNLEWCTCEYNNNYGTRNQRAGEALSIPVDMLTKQGELIRQFPSGHEAERFLRNNGYPSASSSQITKCCKGNPNYTHAYGFKWRYSKPN